MRLSAFLLFFLTSGATSQTDFPIYDGITCMPFSTSRNEKCPIPGLCLRNSSCVLWRTGEFHTKLSNRSLSKLLKDFHSYSGFIKGNFDENGRWVSATKLNWISPVSLREHLINEHFAFYGDSILRQVLHRLIFYLRGIPVVAEHYYHEDSYYAFNESHDFLQVGEITKSERDAKEFLLNPLFTTRFYWREANIFYFNHSDTTLNVFGIHYWRNNDLFDFLVPFLKDPRNVFMTTPDLGPSKIFPQTIKYSRRNRYIAENARYVLPLKEMADTGKFEKNENDSMHFQCSFLSDINMNPLEFKTPANGDCSDLFNLNNVMMLTYIALHRHSREYRSYRRRRPLLLQ